MLRLKPSEFWVLTLCELAEMALYVAEDEKAKFDAEHQLLAWQTALLMNATGNYKKTIKPDMLIPKTEAEGTNKQASNNVNRLDRDEKNKKLDDLKAKFAT